VNRPIWNYMGFTPLWKLWLAGCNL
jgi:hypothetical protein